MKENTKQKASTTAVATQPKMPVGEVHDYGADAGAGYENQTQADITIPFLTVLQANSPQITDMEAAKPGMLFNTVTEDLIDPKKGVVLVPATTSHVFVEWVPREKGGGFVATHNVDSPIVKTAMAASKEFGKYFTPAGNDLIETFYVYGCLLDEEDQPQEMVVVAFTSTKIAVYRRWNTKVNMFTVKAPDGRKVRPPLFAHKVRITTVKEKNQKGDYFNFDLQPANGAVAASLLPPGHAALEYAKNVRDMVTQGMAKAAFESQNKGGGAAGGAATNEEEAAEQWQR